MDKFLIDLIYFGACFAIIFLVYIIFINRRRREYTEGKKQLEISYLVRRFDLDMRVTKYKTVKMLVALLNSFIISFTFTVVMNIEKYVWKMLVGFVILFVLTYSLYEIVGKILKKKEER